MSRYTSTGIGYHFGNFGSLNPYVAVTTFVLLVALIVFGLVMFIKAIRNKK